MDNSRIVLFIDNILSQIIYNNRLLFLYELTSLTIKKKIKN